jgi:hypothetical protein
MGDNRKGQDVRSKSGLQGFMIDTCVPSSPKTPTKKRL